jgi:hypothetical protein
MKYFIGYSSIWEGYNQEKEISGAWNSIHKPTDTLEDAHTIARLLHLDVYVINESADGDDWHSKEVFATQNVIDDRIRTNAKKAKHNTEMLALVEVINRIPTVEVQIGKAKIIIEHSPATYDPKYSACVQIGVSSKLIFADGKEAYYFRPKEFISKNDRLLKKAFVKRFSTELGEDTDAVCNTLPKIIKIEEMIANGTYQ